MKEVIHIREILSDKKQLSTVLCGTVSETAEVIVVLSKDLFNGCFESIVSQEFLAPLTPLCSILRTDEQNSLVLFWVKTYLIIIDVSIIYMMQMLNHFSIKAFHTVHICPNL